MQSVEPWVAYFWRFSQLKRGYFTGDREFGSQYSSTGS